MEYGYDDEQDRASEAECGPPDDSEQQAQFQADQACQWFAEMLGAADDEEALPGWWSATQTPFTLDEISKYWNECAEH